MNAIIAKLNDGEHVFFLDIGAKFMEPDGSLTREIMPDFLHLSPKGYRSGPTRFRRSWRN